jgi:hypothetical protein
LDDVDELLELSITISRKGQVEQGLYKRNEGSRVKKCNDSAQMKTILEKLGSVLFPPKGHAKENM